MSGTTYLRADGVLITEFGSGHTESRALQEMDGVDVKQAGVRALEERLDSTPMTDAQRIRHLESRLEHMTKLNALAERAMHSANEASQQYQRMAGEHFDAKEPLEQIADAARAVVDAQGQDVEVRLAELRAALEAVGR